MRLGTDADTCRHELLNAFCEPLIDHSFREPKCFDNTALFGIIGENLLERIRDILISDVRDVLKIHSINPIYYTFLKTIETFHNY